MSSGEILKALRRIVELGRIHSREALELADRELARASTNDPSEVVALARHAGVLATQLGDDRRALRYYKLALDGGDVSVRLARAYLLRDLGDKDAAATELREYLACDHEQDPECVAQARAELAELTKPG